MVLKQEKETIQESGNGRRKEGPLLVEDDTASDDREDIGDREKTISAPRKVDEANDEEMVEEQLDKGELAEVFCPIEPEGIKDGDQIKETCKVIELVSQRDKKRFSFGNLKQKGNRQEKGEDDDAAKHQSLYTL